MSNRKINPSWSEFLKNQVQKMSDQEFENWQKEFEKIRYRQRGNATDNSHLPLTKEEIDKVIGKL